MLFAFKDVHEMIQFHWLLTLALGFALIIIVQYITALAVLYLCLYDNILALIQTFKRYTLFYDIRGL